MRNRHNITAMAARALGPALVIFTSLLWGCITDLRHGGPEPQDPGGEDVEVLLHLRTPGGFAPRGGTRALDYAQENTINDIYVFLFDDRGVLTSIKQGEDVRDRTGGENPMTSPVGGYSGGGEFSVLLDPSVSRSKYRLEIVANLAGIEGIGEILEGLEQPGAAHADVMSALSMPITGAMYTGDGFTGIPMWGSTELMTFSAGGGSVSVELMRSVARIDLGVGHPHKDPATDLWSWNGLEGEDEQSEQIPFRLTGVYVIRPVNRYSIIPSPSHLESLNDKGHVNAPTIIAGGDLPAELSFTAISAEELFAYHDIRDGLYTTRSIYVPEADIRLEETEGQSAHTERMALVVEGYYKGSETKSYYRVDFAGSGGFMDILRNHLYQFNIAGVEGPGQGSVQEAYQASAMNMTVEIIDWDEVRLNNIYMVGDRHFGISQTEVSFTPAGGQYRELTIRTNVEGFTISPGDESGEVITAGEGTQNFSSGDFDYTLTNMGGGLYSLRIEPTGPNVSPGGQERGDEWRITAGVIKGVPLSVTQQGISSYVSMGTAESGGTIALWPEGASIPMEITSSSEVEITTDPQSIEWIGGLPSGVSEEGGVWGVNTTLVVAPFGAEEAGEDGPQSRTATITISIADEEPLVYTITQEAPYLDISPQEVWIARPEQETTAVKEYLAIRTNLPYDDLAFALESKEGLSHTVFSSSSLSRNLRMEITLDAGASEESFGADVTVTPGEKYGLPAARGRVVVRGLREYYALEWSGAVLLPQGVWTPQEGDQGMEYIFPWNTSSVGFTISSNKGLSFDADSSDTHGGTLLSGTPEVENDIVTTPYTFSFAAGYLDYLNLERSYTVWFSSPEGASSSVTFSRAKQEWSHGGATIPTQGFAGTSEPVAIPVTSNINWRATAGSEWITLWGAARDDRRTAGPVVADDAEGLLITDDMSVSVAPITTVNAFASADYKRTTEISPVNMDSSPGGLDLSTQGITVTQYAPVLALRNSPSLPGPGELIPHGNVDYTINALSNIGWGVKAYAGIDNTGVLLGAPVPYGGNEGIVRGAAPAGHDGGVFRVAANTASATRPVSLYLYSTEPTLAGASNEIKIGTWTQRGRPDLVVDTAQLLWDAGDRAPQTVVVDANEEWRASIVPDTHFTLTKGAGAFTVAPKTVNDQVSSRNAEISVYLGENLVATITATQSGAAPYIDLEPTSLYAWPAGSTAPSTITVTSNIPWTVEVTEEIIQEQPVVSFTVSGEEHTSPVGSFVVAPKSGNNPEFSHRGEVIVRGTGDYSHVVRTINVTQSPEEPKYLYVSNIANLEPTDTADKHLTVTSNLDWEVTVSTDPAHTDEGWGGWFTLNTTSGSFNESIGIRFGPNASTSPRKVTLLVDAVVSDPDDPNATAIENIPVREVVVIQNEARLNVPESAPTFSANDSSIRSFTIASNIPWTATLPSESGFTFADGSNAVSGVGNASVGVRATVNETVGPRQATVNITGTGLFMVISTTTTLNQNAGGPTLTLTSGGATPEDLYWDYDKWGNTGNVPVRINVTSNTSWQAAVGAGFQLNDGTTAINGEGNSSFIVYPTQRNRFLSRVESIVTVSTTVGTPQATQSFHVTQGEAPGASIVVLNPPSNLQFGHSTPDGGFEAITFTVEANVPWEVVLEGQDPDGFIAQPLAGYNTGDGTFSVVARGNNPYDHDRTAVVIVRGQGEYRTATSVPFGVMQYAAPPFLSINEAGRVGLTFTPEAAGTQNRLSFIVTSNVPWETRLSNTHPDDFVVEPAQGEGDSANPVTVYVYPKEPNDRGDVTRNLTITVQGVNSQQVTPIEVQVTQNPRTPRLNLQERMEWIRTESGTKQIEISSNVAWAVAPAEQNPGSGFTLQQGQGLSYGTGDGTFSVAVTRNDTRTPREMHFEVTGGALKRSITLWQDAVRVDSDKETLDLAANATTPQTFTVTATADWAAEVTDNSLVQGEHFAFSTTEGGVGGSATGEGKTTVTVTPTPNPSIHTRQFTYDISTTDPVFTNIETVTINQAASAPAITTGDTPLAAFAASVAGADVSTNKGFRVIANIPWQATLDGGNAADFYLSLSADGADPATSVGGTGSDWGDAAMVYVFPRSENLRGDLPRSTNILIKGTGEHTSVNGPTVAVTQNAPAVLWTPGIVSGAEVAWTAAQFGMDVAKTITINSNVPWTILAMTGDPDFFEVMNADEQVVTFPQSGTDTKTFTIYPTHAITRGDIERSVTVTVDPTSAYPTNAQNTVWNLKQARPALVWNPTINVPASTAWTATQYSSAAGVFRDITVTTNVPYTIALTGTNYTDFVLRKGAAEITSDNNTTGTTTIYQIYPRTAITRGDITSRTATLTINPGYPSDAEKPSTVWNFTQNGPGVVWNPTITSTSAWAASDYDGQNKQYTITVNTNVPYTIKLTGTNAGDFILRKAGNSAGITEDNNTAGTTTQYSVVPKNANTRGDVLRTATITVDPSYPTTTANTVWTLNQNQPALRWSATINNTTAWPWDQYGQGTGKTVTIQSNVAWSATINNSNFEMRNSAGTVVTSMSGTGDATFSVNAKSQNTSFTTNRDVTISVVSAPTSVADASWTIRQNMRAHSMSLGGVTQDSSTPSRTWLYTQGGSTSNPLSVTVNANTTWSVSNSNTTDFTVDMITGNGTTTGGTFRVYARNTNTASTTARSATITVTTTTGGGVPSQISHYFTVRQDGAPWYPYGGEVAVGNVIWGGQAGSNKTWGTAGFTRTQAANNPCPEGWRVPTETEFRALLSGATVTYSAASNGVGYGWADVSRGASGSVRFSETSGIDGGQYKHIGNYRTTSDAFWKFTSPYMSSDRGTNSFIADSPDNATYGVRCVRTAPTN